MPKIVIRFDSPDSMSAKMEMDKELVPYGAAYLAVAGDMLIKGLEVELDTSLTDSCVIIDVPESGKDEVRVKIGHLHRKPWSRQQVMLGYFLLAKANAIWMGIDELRQGVLGLAQALQGRPAGPVAPKLILPGGYTAFRPDMLERGQN
ncbi:MAG: hypothetical protein Q8K68_09245 [Nitrospirota bacterium]|nr:hypothetical protein [Nitrospirota bacterium]